MKTRLLLSIALACLPIINPSAQHNVHKKGSNEYQVKPSYSTYVPEQIFQRRIKYLAAIPQPNKRYREAEEFVSRNTLLTGQIIEIAKLFPDDKSRLGIIINAYPTIYDTENSYDLYDAFTYFSTAMRLHDHIYCHQSDLSALSIAPQVAPVPVVVLCEVSNSDFNDIQQRIAALSFDHNKMPMAKEIIRAKACFTSYQIRELVRLLDFEDSKLSLAKYAHDYCIDRQNYYIISDAFSFPNTKNQFTAFLSGK